MARSDVVCIGKHTALYEKENIRGQWMWETDKRKDIITISHGALSSLNLLRWQGEVFVCDTDPGVIESSTYLWEDNRFPHLNLRRPIKCRIEHLVLLYCADRPGTRKLGAVDVDLANCIETCFPILQSVLYHLKEYKVRTKVLLTFRNGRNCRFKSLNERLNWLRVNLPRGVKYVKETPYTSSSVRENASRDKGCSMCLVELHT